jgi:hypothetical protein
MRLATLLALKAFLTSLDGGQNEATVKNLVAELDTEIDLHHAAEKSRVERVFRRSDIVDVEVIDGSAVGTGTPPEPFRPATC